MFTVLTAWTLHDKRIMLHFTYLEGKNYNNNRVIYTCIEPVPTNKVLSMCLNKEKHFLRPVVKFFELDFVSKFNQFTLNFSTTPPCENVIKFPVIQL